MKRPTDTRIARALAHIASVAALLALMLLPAGAARAEEQHTILLRCAGSGFVGLHRDKWTDLALAPPETVRASDGRLWTLEELKALPGFTLCRAVLRWNAEDVQGLKMEYVLACGESRTAPQAVKPGPVLWDVTEPFAAWLEDPGQDLLLAPAYRRESRGFTVAEGSAVLQVTFTADAGAPAFPQDLVQDDLLYHASLSLLEAGSPFIARYDDTAESLVRASLELGVPYYYGGRNEDKFLRRYYPLQTTAYYKGGRMYLCGLDCVGLTQLVMEKRGLPEHPSIPYILRQGAGSSLLMSSEPAQWPEFLLPGDLIAVEHGGYHIMMYLGTLRMFGWTEADAGEALSLLDEPLVIHCGDNPFYYDRYAAYILARRYRETYPPDGGVTVSVIRRNTAGAPHSMTADWGKEFSWYLVDGSPLLVFPLADCSALAWYSPGP